METLVREISNGPIVPNVSPIEIRNHLSGRYDFQVPGDLDEICSDVEHMIRTWNVHVTHPRYFGLYNPGVTLASVVADSIVSMYNPQLATWRTSPAANEIEKHTLNWLTRKFGLPLDTSASFTSGGSEANLSAVIVALTHTFPSYAETGLQNLPFLPTIYATDEAHHSYHKIAHSTGLGRRAVRKVSTGQDLKMDVRDLALRVEEDRKNGMVPFFVVGTAGTTAAGVIDPLADLARYCRAQGLWLHVDAAWGGAAVISPVLKGHLTGIEMADSITCDAHKWFSVPMGTGMFFCRHPEAVSAAFRADSSFMPKSTDGAAADPYVSSLQWSRRFVGLRLFMALAHLGEPGYVEMIEHQARMGDLLRALLQNSGWCVVNETPLPVVCFTRQGLDVTRFVAALLKRQIVWMSEVKMQGIAAVRACISNFRTGETEVTSVVDEMNRLYEEQQSTSQTLASSARGSA